MLHRFELNPRSGIIVATVLIVVLGGTRFWIGWANVDLWRDLLSFLVLGVGSLAAIALAIGHIRNGRRALREKPPEPADGPGPVIDLEMAEPMEGSPMSPPRTGSPAG